MIDLDLVLCGASALGGGGVDDEHIMYYTVKYGYLTHFGDSKFDAKIRLMQISVEP